MAEIIFRASMIILMLIFSINLGIKQFNSPVGFDSRSLIAFAVFAAFILVLGPLWPSNRKIESFNAFLNRFPRASAMTGYLLISFMGFVLAWAAATQSIQWSYPAKSLSKIIGPAGMATIWVLFGLVGLLGFINVLKRKS